MNPSAWISRRFSRSLRSDRFSRFTTMVSIGSVALGCIALILAMSVLRGYENAIEDAALRFTSHIEVRSRFGTQFTNAPEVRRRLASVPGVASTDELLVREGLGRTRHGLDGVLLQGLTASRASEQILPLLIAGTLPTHDARQPRVVVGADLARKLALLVGDTLVVFTTDNMQATQPTPRIIAARVSGIVRSGMQQYDETSVFLMIDDLRAALHLPADAASAIGVRCSDVQQVDIVAEAIGRTLSERNIALTFRQRHYAMYSWIEMQKKPIPIVLGLISIVAIFTVIASLLIAVVEKTRSVAILMSLGMRASHIAQIFVLHGLRIGVYGCVLGCAIAAVALWVQSTYHVITLNGAIYYVSVLPVAITAEPFILVTTTSLTLCLLAALVPTIVARRVSPVRVLRFE